MKDKDRGSATAVLVGVCTLLLVVLLGVGAYLGGWWLQEDSVNRNAVITNNGYNRQTALVSSILDDIKEVEGPNVPAAQRRAIIDQICDNAAQLTGTATLGYNAQNFINTECS